jgi:hypothetical protein
MNHRQSYRQKLELERTALAALGLLSERYAGVSRIEFLMTYYMRSLDAVLMKRTLSFSPADYAGFHMKCMEDGCTAVSIWPLWLQAWLNPIRRQQREKSIVTA